MRSYYSSVYVRVLPGVAQDTHTAFESGENARLDDAVLTGAWESSSEWNWRKPPARRKMTCERKQGERQKEDRREEGKKGEEECQRGCGNSGV